MIFKRKPDPYLKAKRRAKRAAKIASYRANSPREVARRKRQIEQGRLYPN